MKQMSLFTNDVCIKCGDPLPVDRLMMGVEVCELCEALEMERENTDDDDESDMP